MLNMLPFIGWIIALVLNISLAVPFWICWTKCGIGEKYFYYLPPVFQSIEFWACVGLFTCISIIKVVVWPGAVVSSSSTSK